MAGSAFTVAHSITLGLAMYHIISPPANIVEPLIALSILYVALENIVSPRLKPSRILESYFYLDWFTDLDLQVLWDNLDYPLMLI